MALHSTGGLILAGLAAVAIGPAAARVELAPASSPVNRAPRHTEEQAKPAPSAHLLPAAATAAAATAAQGSAGFDAYKPRLMALARAGGVREATIRNHVPGLDLNSTVIRLDRNQPSGSPNSNYIPPFEPYRREHITSSLISRGRAHYRDSYPALYRIYTRYGVDPSVLVAIFGKETSYGAVTGNFDLLQALATLAYEGRRRDFFEQEFVAALKLIDSGVPRWQLEGSWAGATGYPQFMPSNVLRLRADGDGNGYADIWRSEADAFASIANYLRNAGWKPGVAWGVAVRTPANLNRAALRNHLAPTRCERVFDRHSRWLSMREWRALGVTPISRTLPENEMATLLEPDGPGARAFLLTTNYRAILDYNCSNFYALTVGLLSDSIAGR